MENNNVLQEVEAAQVASRRRCYIHVYMYVGGTMCWSSGRRSPFALNGSIEPPRNHIKGHLSHAAACLTGGTFSPLNWPAHCGHFCHFFRNASKFRCTQPQCFFWGEQDYLCLFCTCCKRFLKLELRNIHCTYFISKKFVHLYFHSIKYTFLTSYNYQCPLQRTHFDLIFMLCKFFF